jgi:hypothetical protein
MGMISFTDALFVSHRTAPTKPLSSRETAAYRPVFFSKFQPVPSPAAGKRTWPQQAGG